MKMLFLSIACLLAHVAFAQFKADKFYVFDKGWNPAPMKKAAYLVRVGERSDTCFIQTSYNILGPRIKQESFMDEKGTVKNGKCFYYHANGYLDSAGEFSRNTIHGTWYYWNEEGTTTRQKDYVNGQLVKDTLFPLNVKSMQKTEPVAGEVESEFPGGFAGWSQFLNKNFQYPKRAFDADITGSVHLMFAVDESGNVQMPEVKKSVEYSLDEAALVILSKSPRWTPASKDGKLVKSYKIQPISYKFTR